MRGLSDEEILKKRDEIRLDVEKLVGEEVEVVKSFFDDFNPDGNIPLAYLGRSISLLATADIAYFGEGWKDARGCIIEHACAVAYGISIVGE